MIFLTFLLILNFNKTMKKIFLIFILLFPFGCRSITKISAEDPCPEGYPCLAANPSFTVFGNTNPTASEPFVTGIGFPEGSTIFWKNVTDTSSTSSLFQLKNWNTDDTPLIWSKNVDFDNIALSISARVPAYITRALNTAFQISASRDASVSYSVKISPTLSLTTGEEGTVILEIADNSGFTTNVQEITEISNGNIGNLTIGLNSTQPATFNISGIIPANKWVRLRTVNNTGTPDFTARPGQETLL